MSSEIQYPYAYDECNNLVFIEDIERDERHEHSYHCPECGGEMKPRLGQHNQKHFYHSDNHNCGIESYLHKTAKLLLAERINDRNHPLFIELKPSRPCKYTDTCKEEHFHCWIRSESKEFNLTAYYDLPAEIEADIIEADGGDTHYRPDVLLRSTDPKRKEIFIEVFYKHKSTVDKIKSGRRIIEIKVRSLADLESLRKVDVLVESDYIRFYNFTIPSTPEQIATFLMKYSRECGAELPPDGLPPCLHNPQYVTEHIKCPRCGGKLVFRNGKLGQFYGCSNYPKCRFTTK